MANSFTFNLINGSVCTGNGKAEIITDCSAFPGTEKPDLKLPDPINILSIYFLTILASIYSCSIVSSAKSEIERIIKKGILFL